MSGRDPQWEAVTEARKELKGQRYWQRSDDQQPAYLDDVVELARELAFVMGQAGVTWEDCEKAIAEASPRMRSILDRGGKLEFALCSAIDAKAQELRRETEGAPS